MTTSPDAETPLSSTQKPEPTPLSLIYKLVLTLLASTITVSISYTCYTHYQLTDQIQKLTTDIVTLKQQQTDERTLLATNLEKLGTMQKKLNGQVIVVSKHLSQALQERWYQNNDWLLLKARYYMELAEINGHWSDNTQTTLALLQQADELLAKLHEPELYTIRQAIAEEISLLQSIPTVDIVGLLTKLDAAQQLLANLTIKKPYLPKSGSTAKDTNKISSTWHEQIQHSIQLLKKLVIIRHHDVNVEPLITPENESLMRETCILNLQEAQWAILQRNQDVYMLSLTQAINIIKQTFDPMAKNTQTLLQQLQELRETSLNSQKPPARTSLSLLNQLIESRKNTPAAVTPEKVESQGSTTAPEVNVTSPGAGDKS